MKCLPALCLAFASAISASAMANGSLLAKVTMVRIDKDGRGMVQFDQAATGTPPSCVAVDYAKTFAFDSTTAGGKAIMATALAAKATGNSVFVYGTGACSIYGNYVEDWSYGESR